MDDHESGMEPEIRLTYVRRTLDGDNEPIIVSTYAALLYNNRARGAHTAVLSAAPFQKAANR